MRQLLLISLFATVLFSSCEEPIDDLRVIPSRIVLDGNIQADEQPLVTIWIVDAFGETVTSDILQQSKVTLQSEGSPAIILDLVNFSDTSSTFSTDFIAEAGEKCTLLIQAPGFSDLSSYTEVPKKVVVSSVATGQTGPNGGLLPNGDQFIFPLTFDDTKGKDNYYQVIVTAKNADSTTDDLYSKTIAYNVLPRPSDAKRFRETGWIFSDKDFRDSRFRSEIVILKESVLEFSKPVVSIELRSVSVDYFNFHIQNSRPKSGDLPDHNQSGTIDNVAGGVGLFGAYSSHTSDYELEF